ncbi:MAG: hypothetical protein KF809_14950 [Chloroflexi bacterium]|nr:hypothetical protein [Chloroflexota bacterium]
MDVTGIATAIVVGVLSGIAAAMVTSRSNERIAGLRIGSDERIARDRLEADRVRWTLEMERAQADRFLELRRDRYATFLARVEDAIQVFLNEHREPAVTGPEQDAMLALAGMKGELELLSPVVAEHANWIAGGLAGYSISRSHTEPADARRAQLVELMDRIHHDLQPAFLDAARRDLGITRESDES